MMTVRDAYDPLGTAGGSRTPPPRIRIAVPNVGEEEVAAVTEVLGSGILTNGPATKRFEDAMAQRHGAAHAVAFANGTMALAAMYLACGIGPGDEVIVPSLTFISTATSVLHIGATPVFADVSPDTLNLDPDDVARRMTPRTRAIVPVHYGGQAADLDELRAIADAHGAVVLEDAAEAHGARYRGRPVGSTTDAAMFSFTPTKNITTGEGGIVTTNRSDLDQAMRLLRNHGMDAPYHHAALGWNWRITEMQAAMGVCQVERLDHILERKRANAAALTARLAPIAGVQTPTEAPDRDHTYMLYTVQLPADRRDQVAADLAADGIEARIYFPPAHLQPVFADTPSDGLAVTEDVARRILSLPVHLSLSEQDLDDIAASIARSLA